MQAADCPDCCHAHPRHDLCRPARVSPGIPTTCLTTAPDGKREFEQFQLNLEVARPNWGASASFVSTRLTGNLDNVSGYTDPEGYGAGPYVRVNEGVNSYGTLENFADREWKVSFWGASACPAPGRRILDLPIRRPLLTPVPAVRAGLLPLQGEHRSLDGWRGFRKDPVRSWTSSSCGPWRGTISSSAPGDSPPWSAGTFSTSGWSGCSGCRGMTCRYPLDWFNVLRVEAITALNTMVNNGPDYGFGQSASMFGAGISPNQYYQAPQERISPTALRFGLAVYF